MDSVSNSIEIIGCAFSAYIDIPEPLPKYLCDDCLVAITHLVQIPRETVTENLCPLIGLWDTVKK